MPLKIRSESAVVSAVGRSFYKCRVCKKEESLFTFFVFAPLNEAEAPQKLGKTT